MAMEAGGCLVDAAPPQSLWHRSATSCVRLVYREKGNI